MSNGQRKDRVTFAESHLVATREIGEFIERWLGEKQPRLFLTGCDGRKPYGPQECTGYGISFRRESLGQEIFLEATGFFQAMTFRRPTTSPTITTVGNVYIHKNSKMATNKRWMAKVYGREHVPLFMQLAEELSEKYEVEVHVRLYSEQTKRKDIIF